MIPYGRQSIDESDIEAVTRVLRSDWLTTGPEVEAFEEELAEVIGAKYVVVCSSGTAALWLAYAACGLQADDDVLVPGLTFAATANAAAALGANVTFADVDTNGLVLPVNRNWAAEQLDIIVGVDYAGLQPDYERIRTHKRQFVIADACHSLGVPMSPFAQVACYSFHPVKSITTGEGGAVVTNDEAIAYRVRALRSHGMVDGEQRELSSNLRLSDIACALGRSQLKRLPQFLARRREIAERYDEAFASLPITRMGAGMRARSACHLYPVILTQNRERFRAKLLDAGVGTQIHYKPVYTHPYWREQLKSESRVASCPTLDSIADSLVSLPLYPGLTDSEVEHVIDTVRAAVERG